MKDCEITDAMREAMPPPVYGCAMDGCAEEATWPAEDIQWVRDGFYCDACRDYLEPPPGDDEYGPTLAKVLAAVEAEDAEASIKEAASIAEAEAHYHRYGGEA